MSNTNGIMLHKSENEGPITYINSTLELGWVSLRLWTQPSHSCSTKKERIRRWRRNFFSSLEWMERANRKRILLYLIFHCKNSKWNFSCCWFGFFHFTFNLNYLISPLIKVIFQWCNKNIFCQHFNCQNKSFDYFPAP